MSPENVAIARPILSGARAIWFSAYGFGWGYRAFELPFEVACEKLGAADPTAKHALLAFELGKRQILRVVDRKPGANTGERLTLAAQDFSGASGPDAVAGRLLSQIRIWQWPDCGSAPTRYVRRLGDG